MNPIDRVIRDRVRSSAETIKTLDALIARLKREMSSSSSKMRLDHIATSVCRVVSERRSELDIIDLLERAHDVVMACLAALEDCLDQVAGLDRSEVERLLAEKTREILESR